ncbi:hypothetical protein QGM71_06890 [Virgibacillus sp. C22-A2]|uniref:Uncharacterized protein n=1 Tax=Virgibacillus tibetensis TaxID=3042313 RepID=A0ABU6KFJ4_9BACI|nr:hypothetical protein [Virgibacillus sp. C22-A2]
MKNSARIMLTTEDGQQEALCQDCYNEDLSVELGIPLEKQPKSFTVKDANGAVRHFTVEKTLFPMGISLEAVETIGYGYKYGVHGELECDQQQLFQKLVSKVKRGVARNYIKEVHMPNGIKVNSMTGDRLVGRIEYSEETGDVPLLIIDGKPYTWDEIGKILMSNEGFQFRLDIIDMTDDAN